MARLHREEFRTVLLASQREGWDRNDRDVRFALNDYDPVRSGEAYLIPRRGVIVYPDARGSTHGSQYEYDTNVPLVFWGGGVKAGVSDADRTPYDFGHVRDEVVYEKIGKKRMPDLLLSQLGLRKRR